MDGPRPAVNRRPATSTGAAERPRSRAGSSSWPGRRPADARRLTRGAVNKEIAAALEISENTVKNHLKNIMEKLHLENRVQVVAYALREGLVRPRDVP